MVVGVVEDSEAEVEELVTLLVEDCEAPLVVEDAELCPVELERPEWEDSDGLEEGEEPEVDPDASVPVDPEAVLVTLLEPLAVLEKLPVEGMPVFGSDQQ